MLNQFLRTKLLLGQDALDKLANSRVAVFGLGGVGGYTVEALVRCGLGEIDIIDNDKISLTNLNRQLHATHTTIGKYKVDVTEERIKDINPNIKINKYNIFYTPDTSNSFNFDGIDYIVDAIDTVVGKISLIEKSKEHNIPIISAMGAGNKLDPTRFEVADISKTSVCPLARVLRGELKKRKIKNVKVVYSKEQPIKPLNNFSIDNKTNGKNLPDTTECNKKHQIPGSISFVPSVVGLIIASEVVKDLIKYNENC